MHSSGRLLQSQCNSFLLALLRKPTVLVTTAPWLWDLGDSLTPERRLSPQRKVVHLEELAVACSCQYRKYFSLDAHMEPCAGWSFKKFKT